MQYWLLYSHVCKCNERSQLGRLILISNDSNDPCVSITFNVTSINLSTVVHSLWQKKISQDFALEEKIHDIDIQDRITQYLDNQIKLWHDIEKCNYIGVSWPMTSTNSLYHTKHSLIYPSYYYSMYNSLSILTR